MSLLFDVIVAHRCRSTHHYIAIEALTLLQCDDAERWRDLLLARNKELLAGAKAPDSTFRDFKNHVLHVSDNNWGGAPKAAAEWYDKAVIALEAKKWPEAAYALGVMSHYYADPIQPFHTGQTEEEGSLHRALEWSIAKSRDVLKGMIMARGYPRVQLRTGDDFVAEMVLDGARRSHPHYQTFIDHYDIHTGVKDPPAGLDDTLREVIADLIGYATSGLATLYTCAFTEAGVIPPKVDLTLKGYLSTVDIPVRSITKKLSDQKDRKIVEAMYQELQATGKVVKTLPDDDKAVRALHASEVLNRDLADLDKQPIKPTGTRFGKPLRLRAGMEAKSSNSQPVETPVSETRAKDIHEPPRQKPKTAPAPVETGSRSGLTLDAPVVDAPSIGSKTAKRLERIGIKTIADFLESDPLEVAPRVRTRYITEKSLEEWQVQTRLMLDVPGLRVHDAQILVGIGVTSRRDLMNARAADVFDAALSFIKTTDGKRFIRNESDKPDKEEVDHWIDLAKDTSSG